MTGFGIGKNDKITFETYGNRRDTDNVDIKDLKARLDIDIFFIMLLYVVPAFLKRSIPQEYFVIH
jgi:hypothetical protein